MATEKLAKGFLTPSEGGPYEFTHKAFVRLIRDASNMPRIRERWGKTRHHGAYRSFLRSIEPLAAEIEGLAPGVTMPGEADGEHPNPEYPWQDGTGTVCSPLRYAFSGLEARDNPRLRELLQLVEVFLSVAAEERDPAA